MTCARCLLVSLALSSWSCSTATPPAGDGGAAVDASGSEGPPDGASTPDGASPPDRIPTPDGSPAPDGSPVPDGPLPDGAPAPDGAAGPDASTCPTAPCDLVEQCGCPSPLVCDIDSADPFGDHDCRSVTNSGTEEDTCAALEDCDGGYVCVGSESDSTCKRYCAGDQDCDGPRGRCAIQLQSQGDDIPGAVVCSSNCRPTDESAAGCPAGYGCFLFEIDPDGDPGSGDEIDIVDCSPAGGGTQGTSCTGYADCAPGFLCLDAGSGGECLRMCDEIGNACAAEADTTCTGFDPAADVGGTEYGVCL